MRQLALAIHAPTEPSLENFVAGVNAEVLARVREAAAGRAPESVIYLWGEPGCGRTHLLRAAVRAARDAVYVGRADALPTEAPRLLAVDEVEGLGEADQVALFHLVNRCRDAGGCVLAAGDTPPAGLALREDLRTRLGWGLGYELRPLADADKARYVHAEASRRGLRLADEVVWYLLTHVRRDLPSLNAIIEHLDRYSLERHRLLTLPLVRDALRELET